MRGRCGFAGGWALRRDEDPFRHPACGRRRVTPPPEGEARAWVRIRPESPHRQPPRGRSAAATSPNGGGKSVVRIRPGVVLERRGIPPGRRGRRPLRRRRGWVLRTGGDNPTVPVCALGHLPLHRGGFYGPSSLCAFPSVSRPPLSHFVTVLHMLTRGEPRGCGRARRGARASQEESAMMGIIADFEPRAVNSELRIDTILFSL